MFTPQDFLKYVWPFFNIMHEGTNIETVKKTLYSDAIYLLNLTVERLENGLKYVQS